MQKLFWFFQQVCKNFQQNFVLDASFFVIFLKTNAKIELIFSYSFAKIAKFFCNKLVILMLKNFHNC